MPPRKRPQRRGLYAEAVRPELSAAAYRWPCPRCDCRRNLRGLLREVCSHCTHVHQNPDAPQKEFSYDDRRHPL